MNEPQSTSEPFLLQVLAGPMGNCLYILGDPETKKAWVVDPAWDPVGIVRAAEAQGYEVEAVLATHFHQDHIGGEIMGQHIPGVKELRDTFDIPMLIHSAEAERGAEIAHCPENRVQTFSDGDRLPLGNLEVEVIHTPGHSPGSSCFRCGSHVITADTLFVQGIGRVDLPHSDPIAMYHSLERLKTLPRELNIYPGHNYGPAPTSTIGQEIDLNPYLRCTSVEQWRMFMGGL